MPIKIASEPPGATLAAGFATSVEQDRKRHEAMRYRQNLQEMEIAARNQLQIQHQQFENFQRGLDRQQKAEFEWNQRFVWDGRQWVDRGVWQQGQENARTMWLNEQQNQRQDLGEIYDQIAAREKWLNETNLSPLGQQWKAVALNDLNIIRQRKGDNRPDVYRSWMTEWMKRLDALNPQSWEQPKNPIEEARKAGGPVYQLPSGEYLNEEQWKSRGQPPYLRSGTPNRTGWEWQDAGKQGESPYEKYYAAARTEALKYQPTNDKGEPTLSGPALEQYIQNYVSQWMATRSIVTGEQQAAQEGAWQGIPLAAAAEQPGGGFPQGTVPQAGPGVAPPQPQEIAQQPAAAPQAVPAAPAPAGAQQPTQSGLLSREVDVSGVGMAKLEGNPLARILTEERRWYNPIPAAANRRAIEGTPLPTQDIKRVHNELQFEKLKPGEWFFHPETGVPVQKGMSKSPGSPPTGTAVDTMVRKREKDESGKIVRTEKAPSQVRRQGTMYSDQPFKWYGKRALNARFVPNPTKQEDIDAVFARAPKVSNVMQLRGLKSGDYFAYTDKDGNNKISMIPLNMKVDDYIKLLTDAQAQATR